MQSFITECSSETASRTWKPSEAERVSLESAAAALSGSTPLFGKAPLVTWYGDYGCALLAWTMRVDDVQLELLGLDCWAFRMHSGPAARTFGARAALDTPVSLHVAQIKTHQLEKFQRLAAKFLDAAKERKGDKRSAAANEQGNQKTPSMIHAVLIDAIAALDTEPEPDEGSTAPRGGFTDVGLHTGGLARDTAWPLVRSVLQVTIEAEANHELYRKTMAQLLLRVAESGVSSLESSISFKDQCNAIMQLLRDAASEGAALVDTGVDMGAFGARCVIVRHEVEKLITRRESKLAMSFVLPPLKRSQITCADPKFSLPDVTKPARGHDGLAASRERAKSELRWLPSSIRLRDIFSVQQYDAALASANPSIVLVWLKHERLKPQANHHVSALHAMNEVERFAYKACCFLQPTDTLPQDFNCANWEALVEDYRKVLSVFSQSQGSVALLTPELLSREVLVVWIATCLSHKFMQQTNPLLESYSIPLDPNDLRHLVLSERLSIDAARNVVSYLRTNRDSGASCVFSHRSNDATFEFARKHASNDSQTRAMWKTEKEAADARQEARWEIIQQKQAKLRDELDPTLSRLKTELQEQRTILNSCYSPAHWTTNQNDRRYYQSKDEISSLLSQISMVESEIAETEKAPAEILQPLPKTEQKALPILFWINMSSGFCVLSRLCFMAQQMLLPRMQSITLSSFEEEGEELDVEKSIECDNPKSNWRSYYSRDSTRRSFNAVETKVVLGSFGKVVSGNWFSKNVRTCSTSSDGVWYPDSLTPHMFWYGGSFSLDDRGCCFDPFRALPAKTLVQKFTVQLSTKDQAMQWAMEQHGDESQPERCNVPEAVQDKIPSWLIRKPEFLSFGALRAYPKQQLRQLLSALHDRRLPLDQAPVRLLLLQTLYHLGELSWDAALRPVWRTDLEECNGWETLCVELQGLAEELRFKPREHGAVLVLGEIAAHASQWHEPCREVAREFARIARTWSDELDKEITSALPENVPALRAKRCLYCMYGVVCHSAGELSDADVASLCQLAVLAEYNRLLEDPTPLDEQVKSLTAMTNGIMTRQMPKFLSMLDRNSQLLTNALRLVLEATPERLSWQRVKVGDDTTCCYEAVDGHQNLFSINLLTGIVLYNGLPPRRLPSDIVSKQLYQRTFADRNFEVVMDATGVFTTTRQISGRIYTFFVNAENALIVRERDELGNVLELLDSTEEGVTKWGNELPIRLRHMHSHWLRRPTCHDQRSVIDAMALGSVVLFRPRAFNNRSVQFLCVSERRDGAQCYRVPEHLQQAPWTALHENAVKESFDRLMLPEEGERVVRILRKFEPNKELIHTLQTSIGDLLFELPRYGLTFELKQDGHQLSSKNFLGFCLSATQQLETLHGFEQYLILESGKQKLIVVPRGMVECNGGQVNVSGPDACDAERKLHAYDEHERFKTLDAPAGRHSVLARLQLAALYAATSSAVPERRLQQTGSEMAVELVRQCWVNHPLDKEESQQLKSIARFATLSPSLPLICHELDVSSREMSFLYPNKQLFAKLDFNADAATEYTQRKQGMQLSPREILSTDEEVRVLAHSVRERSIVNVQRTLEIPRCASASPEKVIRETEASLKAMLRGNEPTYDDLKESELMDVTDFASSNLAMVMQHAGSSRTAAAKALNSNHGNLTDAIKELTDAPEERTASTSFPLNATAFESTQLGKHMMNELIESWDTHQMVPAIRLAFEPKIIAQNVSSLREKISSHREEVEQYLLRVVSCVPEACPASFNMRRAANLAPCVTLRDLARAALDTAELRRFNPFLSASAQAQLHESVLDWLKYCVLEDQLERMRKLALRGDVQELERELKEIGREWDVHKHPAWLVFEVEQQLKIRRVQYTTAKHLIDTPGAVTQLNMGEGKTRVILPMLHLHLGRQGALVRLHFLSQLIGEAYHFLHRHITASLMSRRLCLLPFHRDVRLTINDTRRMYEGLVRCMRTGGAVCIAPEHRLSLQLKWHELYLSGEGSSAVDTATFAKIRNEIDCLHKLPYHDIFDESDEELRHQYQLIYAWGSCKPLPAGPQRWVAAEALLLEIQNNPIVARILAKDDVSKRLPAHGKTDLAGNLDDLRLLPGDALDQVRSDLLFQLAQGVVNRPPHEMRWLRLHGQQHKLQREIINFVITPEAELEHFQKHWREKMGEEIKSVQCSHLLALRGLLAYGLLEHCLTRRHRVDYGVDPRRGVQRLVAVPFRASDTPSERAEYAQPDTMIIYTLLSYYHDGLTRGQMKEAVRTLLALGPQAQRAEYDLWFASAQSVLKDEQKKALGTVDKLDLTSEPQFDLLFKAYKYNMATISFWLNSCVFPRETMQFPNRLVANAFNLTDIPSGKVIGFSGTKDNNLLLPLHVQQRLPADEEMAATDGKMLSLVLRSSVHCLTNESEDRSKLFADSVLERAVLHDQSSALIDAGASMAGLNNAEVAERILNLQKMLPDDAAAPLQGVVFFEPKFDTWYVLARNGGLTPLGSSPIHERDSFVYFDESRCRGADMKMKPTAQATLTIGPGMCKDKVMQAAGRMRKLALQQRLVLIVPAELVSKIHRANAIRPTNTTSPLTALHVMNWVMHNTIRTTADGLPEWASQGSHFCTTRDPKARLIDESLELEGLYGRSIAECTVYDHVKRGQTKDLARISQLGLEPSPGDRALMSRLSEERAKQYGSDLPIRSTGLDEECERELENERELEREAERQYPRCAPQSPKVWDFAALLTAQSPTGLQPFGIVPIEMAIKQSFSKELSMIKWKYSGIYVTRNYLETVMSKLGAKLEDLGDYMRPVQSIVTFPSKDCLLLSEWEAEKVIDLMWKTPHNPKVHLITMCYLRAAADALWESPAHLIIPKAAAQIELVNDVTMAGLQLLAGETMFGPPNTPIARSRVAALAKLLPTTAAKKAALSLPFLCGLQHNVARSELELFCNLDVGDGA